MAFQNNPNSWNGGTAVFDPSPIIQAQTRLALHKQAKNEALDEYYRQKSDSVNSAGMRSNDIPDLSKKVEDLKTYYLVNKDKLRKGDIMANAEFDRKYRDAQGFVNDSKNTAKDDENIFKAQATFRKDDGTVPDDFIEKVHNHNRPLLDPEFKRFDVSEYQSEPKKYDVAKGLKNYEDIKPEPGAPIVGGTDQTTGKRLITTPSSYSDGSKANLYTRAGTQYHNDRSFKQFVDEAKNNEQTKGNLDKLYTDQYGKAPETPEDYAAAVALSMKGVPQPERKLEDDKEWAAAKRNKEREQLLRMRQAGQEALEGLRNKNRLKLADYRNKLKKMGGEEQANVLDNTFDALKQEAINSGARQHFAEGGKPDKIYYEANLPNNIKKELAHKAGTKTIYPDKIYFNKDSNKIDVIFYQKNDDETNKKVNGKNAIDGESSHSIDENQLKAIMGHKLFGVKTTSGATYYGDDGDDEENDDDSDDGTIAVPVKKDPLGIF